MEHICQLTNLITNSQLLKTFIGPILTNALIWMIAFQFSWNFQQPPSSLHFSIRHLFQYGQNIYSSKKTLVF